ncbi:LAQU0S03e01442g1_1 [Lachancea quebecensis]|uniref:LAQU0S03e01442g1_1 n=1 Tax=Lachancea quebecensis TaxID=1654605 RepID=A0A0P1KP53_9SACH|nr:LAQU0S03e01442g1_1 [Lachancea quebecensis]
MFYLFTLPGIYDHFLFTTCNDFNLQTSICKDNRNEPKPKELRTSMDGALDRRGTPESEGISESIFEGLEVGFLKDNDQWVSKVKAVNWDDVASLEEMVKATEQLVLKYSNPNQHIKHSIKKVFEKVLGKYPLLFGYWKRFTAVQYQLNGLQSSIDVLSQAVDAFPNSLELWCDYLSVLLANNPDQVDQIRVNFHIAKDLVGLQFLSHPFWDKFIEFETKHEQWKNVLAIYHEVSRVPLHQYSKYYTAYKQLAERNDTGIKIKEDIDQVFANTQKLVNEVWRFESQIAQSFFNVGPLRQKELDNWDQYLNFVIDSKHFPASLVKSTFLRCLIPCWNYEHFWLRFTKWLEEHSELEECLDMYQKGINVISPEMRTLRQQFLDYMKGQLKHDADKVLELYLLTLSEFSRIYPQDASLLVEFLAAVRRTSFASNISQTDQEILGKQTSYASYLERNVRCYTNKISDGDVKLQGILNDRNLSVAVVELIKVTQLNLRNASQSRKYFKEFESLPQIRNSTAFWLLYYKFLKVSVELNELERFVTRLGTEIFLPTLVVNDILDDFRSFFLTNVNYPDYEHEVYEGRYTSGIDPLMDLHFKLNNPLWVKQKSADRQRKEIKDNGHVGLYLEKPEISNTIIESQSKSFNNGPPSLPTFKNLDKTNKQATFKDFLSTDYINVV